MSGLLARFDDLLSHLNSEENDMALEFREELVKASRNLEKLEALENYGVDNWEGYGEAISSISDDE